MKARIDLQAQTRQENAEEDQLAAILSSPERLSAARKHADAMIDTLREHPEFSTIVEAPSIELIRNELEKAEKDPNSIDQDKIKMHVERLRRIREQNPKEFEDFSALVGMKEHGFTPLNKRVSYHVGGDSAFIHLAASFAVKDELPELFRDGMQKLAGILLNRDDIHTVRGTSWLVATKTYGELLQQFGFSPGHPVSEEIKQRYFPDESRPVWQTEVSKDDFIRINSQ